MMGARARSVALTRFGYDVMVDAYLALYDQARGQLQSPRNRPPVA